MARNRPGRPGRIRLMRKYASTCSSVAAAILLSTMSHAQTRDIGVHGEMLDPIAAIVNDGLVLKSELDAQMDAATKRLQEQKVELPPQSVLKPQGADPFIMPQIDAHPPNTSDSPLSP